MEDEKKVAEYILGLQDMGLSQEISLEDALKELEDSVRKLKGKGEYSDKLFDYLLEAAQNAPEKAKEIKEACDQVSTPDIKGCTDYGTPYALIARYILAMQGTRIFNYDDEFHYQIIEDGLKRADKNLLYYLSRGIENVMQ